MQDQVAGKLVSTNEVMSRLKLSRPTALSLIRAGAIPDAFQINRRWRIPSSSLDDYITEQQEIARTANA